MKNYPILIGSTHDFIDDFKKQKEVILLEKPKYVLSEELEDKVLNSKKNFSKILKTKKMSNMTSFKEVEKLIRLCKKEGINLIGIDLENFGFNRTLQKKIKEQSPLTLKEEKLLEKIVSRREKLHLTKIKSFLKKTDKTIVVIVGTWHLRKGSLLRTKLKKYKIIAPCDKNRKILIGPPSSQKDIKYLETTKT